MFVSCDKSTLDVWSHVDLLYQLYDLLLLLKLLITRPTKSLAIHQFSVLIEKLLRSCGDVDTIYVLVRNKKGKDARGRLHELLDDFVSI